jgi:hypothetical protein
MKNGVTRIEFINFGEKIQAIASKDSRKCNDDQSVLSILCATDWIRILVVCNKSTEIVTIEVELSPPTEKGGVSHSQNLVRNRYSKMIDNLNYLLRLNEMSFILKTSEEDCLWTASLEVKGNLESSMFEILLPPGAQNIVD